MNPEYVTVPQANPGGSVSDLEALAGMCGDAKIPLIVDNTLATPVLCKPIDHGADLVRVARL